MTASFDSLIYYEIGKGPHDLPNVIRYFRTKEQFNSMESARSAIEEVCTSSLGMYRPSCSFDESHDDHDHSNPGKKPSKEDLSIKIEKGKNLYVIRLVADGTDYDGHACFWEANPITVQGLNNQPVSRLLDVLSPISPYLLVFMCDRDKLIAAVADIYNQPPPAHEVHFLLPFHFDLRDVASGMPIGLHADHLFGQDAGLSLMGRKGNPPFKFLKHGGYHPPGVASYLQV